MTTLIHSLSQFLSCQPSQIPPTSSEQLRSTADERIKCSFSEEKIPPRAIAGPQTEATGD